MLVSFVAINGRSNPVALYSVTTHGTRQLKGQLQSGAQGTFSAPVDEYWEAHDGGSLVAVYEASPRVTTWTIPSAATGLPLDLEARDAGDYNESLKFNDRFLKAEGTIPAAMMFVDFSDASAAGNSWADEKKIEARLVGDAAKELQKVSFGAADLTVTPIAGWRQMPRPVASYAEDTRGFVEDAVKLFPGEDFSRYKVLYIVAAQTPSLPVSPAWIAPLNDPIKAGTADIEYAVTFGQDSYLDKNKTFLLLHETYHFFGLPDLYDGGAVSGKGYSSRGLEKWDLMASQEGDSELLGWHRLKLGWLHSSQVVCLYNPGSIDIELADWRSPDGVKAVMVPVTSAPAPESAALAYIVEVASGGAGRSPGVLVYSVNASLPTWERPIQMRGGADALSPKPLTEGEFFSHLSTRIGVKVLSRNRAGFRVQVDKG
jgi:M6 family metalloprotease-like protein